MSRCSVQGCRDKPEWEVYHGPWLSGCSLPRALRKGWWYCCTGHKEWLDQNGRLPWSRKPVKCSGCHVKGKERVFTLEELDQRRPKGRLIVCIHCRGSGTFPPTPTTQSAVTPVASS